MTLVALALCATLTIVAALHLYWGLGGVWPAQTEPDLLRTVVGVEGEQMPGRALTVLVALLIQIAALIPPLYLGLLPHSFPLEILRLGMIVLTLIFFARGGSSYLPKVSRLQTVQPFRRLNLHYFSPLCLLISAGYLMILLG